MIDDFDLAAATLPDDTAFHNLRSLITSSPHADSLRLVVTGSSRINDLVKAGSPLNVLDPIFLGILPESNAREVMRVGDAVTLVVTSFAPGRRSVDMARLGFELGEVRLVDYILEQRRLIDVETGWAQARAELLQARYELERAVGRRLSP